VSHFSTDKLTTKLEGVHRDWGAQTRVQSFSTSLEAVPGRA